MILPAAYSHVNSEHIDGMSMIQAGHIVERMRKGGAGGEKSDIRRDLN